MKLKHITDIFFDLDHTLWDFDKNSALAFQKIFEINHVNINVPEFLKHYEPINLNYWKLYREEKIDKESLRYKRLSDTFEAIKYSPNDGLINKLSIDYITHLIQFNHLFEGTVTLLNYLDLNYNLHIITNGFEEAQLGKLKNANIINYFKTITTSEMVGVKKPNPKIFNYALTQANAIPEKSIMIGDNYEADVLGALDFGMDAICFNYHKLEIHPDIKLVTTLNSLKAYF
ncbi:MAG: YjjG family noncanonical pyrimidine nucleotidase [Oceanihabitans sp.]